MHDRTEKLRAHEFLCANNLGVFSTIGSTYPESSLLYYIVDEKYSVFMITTKQSRKINNLLNNNKASLVIFSEVPPIELQIDGEAERVDDQDKKNYIAKLYMEMAGKNPETKNWPPLMKLPNRDGFEFIKLNISHFKYSDFRQEDTYIVEGTPEDWD